MRQDEQNQAQRQSTGHVACGGQSEHPARHHDHGHNAQQHIDECRGNANQQNAHPLQQRGRRDERQSEQLERQP